MEDIRHLQDELLAYIGTPTNTVTMKCWHCDSLVKESKGVRPSSFEREVYHPYCYLQYANQSGNGVGVRPLSEEDLLNVTKYRLAQRRKKLASEAIHIRGLS